MAENPLKSLIPKDSQGEGMGKELAEKATQVSNARQALTPPVEAAKSTIGKPAHMTPAQGPFGSQPGEKRIDVTSYQKPLGQMHKGGTVPKTGPYVMKAGEKVLTPEQHGHITSALSLAQSALSHDPQKDAEPAKEVKDIHLRKGANGGFIAKHIHTHFSHPDEEHVHPTMDHVHDSLEQHWGDPNSGENASESEKDESPGVAAAEKAIGLEK